MKPPFSSEPLHEPFNQTPVRSRYKEVGIGNYKGFAVYVFKLYKGLVSAQPNAFLSPNFVGYVLGKLIFRSHISAVLVLFHALTLSFLH